MKHISAQWLRHLISDNLVQVVEILRYADAIIVSFIQNTVLHVKNRNSHSILNFYEVLAQSAVVVYSR